MPQIVTRLFRCHGEDDGATSIPGVCKDCSSCSPATLNIALLCAKPKMSVLWGVFGEPSVQTAAWLQRTSVTPFGVPAAPRHSPHGAQLQMGLGPAALVLSC